MTARSAWPTRCWAWPRRSAGRSSKSASPIRAPWRHLVPALWFQPLAGAGRGRRPARAALAGSRHRVRPQRRRAGARGQARERRRARSGCRSRIRAMRAASADLMVVPSHDPAPRRQRLHHAGRGPSRDPGAARRRRAPVRRRFCAHLPRPLVAVLIGGDNRVYRLTPERFAALAAAARGAAPQRASGSPSRRRAAPARRRSPLLRDAACGAAGLSSGTAPARTPISACSASPTRSSSPPIPSTW